MSKQQLQFLAGRGAYDDIRRHGFSEDRIGAIVGASGGAKWLVLSQLDKVICRRVLPKLVGPVHLLGSSIGAWRFTCYAQQDPVRAIERFERLYVEQSYSEKPDADEITRVGREILSEILGDSGVEDIVGHPVLRTNIMTARCRHLTATDRRPLLATGLIGAIAANMLSRRALGLFFERGLFFDARDLPPFYDVQGFPLERIRLSAENLLDAVIASGSIPMVLNGVRDIHGAPAGTYRDGGIIDYHLDIPATDADRITLFPHFFNWFKPGWFDRQLPWRRLQDASLDRAVVVCPSAEFIASLPHAKVPNRQDFVDFPQVERVQIWQTVVERCEELADEFNEVLERGHVGDRLQPIGV